MKDLKNLAFDWLEGEAEKMLVLARCNSYSSLDSMGPIEVSAQRFASPH